LLGKAADPHEDERVHLEGAELADLLDDELAVGPRNNGLIMN
jgi:hypothetical protein